MAWIQYQRRIHRISRACHFPHASTKGLKCAAQYIARFLVANWVPFYICGGYACLTTADPKRLTSGLDIVVDTHQPRQLMASLLSDPHFVTDPTHTASTRVMFLVEATEELVEIDIIPGGWGGIFPFVAMMMPYLEKNLHSIPVPSISVLLRMKLKTYSRLATKPFEKRQTEGRDIWNLRKRMKAKKQYFDPELDEDEYAGLQAWLAEHHDEGLWVGLGIPELDDQLRCVIV
ncbi:hypothetical protein DL93DRAFT_2166912 [Clavulina sp. PMI_390]|nr:hypothetical protein DL93DRAFT_2166912 [Clavulina sp. PMI_390]